MKKSICTAKPINNIYSVPGVPNVWTMLTPAKYFNETCKHYNLISQDRELSKLNVAIDNSLSIKSNIDMLKIESKHILINGWIYLINSDASLIPKYLILTNQKNKAQYYYLLTKSRRDDIRAIFLMELT